MEPQTGVVVWRPVDHERFFDVAQQLSAETVSSPLVDVEPWLRDVAANLNADIAALAQMIWSTLDGAS